MAELPNKNDLISGTTTEAQFQSALGDLYDVLAQLALMGPYEPLELDGSGAVTPTKCFIQVDNQSGSAADDLNFIIPTNIGQKVIFVVNTSPARPTKLKHDVSGTGKLNLLNGVDVTLTSPRQVMALMWNDTTGKWDELWRNWGLMLLGSTDAAAIRTQLGLGTAALVNTGIGTGQVPLYSQLGNAASKTIGVLTGQVPTADQLGSLAFLSQINASMMAGSGVTPGNYNNFTVNAQGLITAASLVESGIGTGQTWQAVTRTHGTSYTNSTGKPISLVYDGYSTNGAVGYIAITIDGVTMRFGGGQSWSNATPVLGSIIIPVGATYVLTESSIATRNVYELR